MIFWTVVSFVLYAALYFVVSQRKIKRMRRNILLLERRLHIMRNRTTGVQMTTAQSSAY